MGMNITVIRAACAKYSRAELVAKRDVALSELEKGAVIVSVNTGAGTAYTRAVEMKAQEAVEFWQACIDCLDEMEGRGSAPSNKVNLLYTGFEAC